MSKKFTSLLGILLEGVQYVIKTTRGISEDKYRHTFHFPVFGSGQGSTASATGWGKSVSRALKIHDNSCHGSNYIDPAGLLEVIISMLSYVDDNNISNNGSTRDTITDVLKRTQHDAQMWNDILLATGGH